MNTLRGVARKTASSPKLLLQVTATVGAVVAGLVGVARSEALFDDVLIVLLVVILAKIVYLQSDWALPPVEKLNPEVVWRIPVRAARAALTIDDVPLLKDPTRLEEILDVLKANGVRATFFVMSGYEAAEADGGLLAEARERCRRLLERAVAEGHEMANHLMFDYPAIAMPPEDFERAFRHCDDLLAALHGGEAAWRARPRRWFRPPSAMWSRHMLAVAREKGYTTVIANCYPHDVAAVTRHINPIYLSQRVRPGAVIVLHDRWHTHATLAKALPLIAKRGVQLGTLSELQAAADAEAQEGLHKPKLQ